MAVGSSLLVDRAQQVEHLNDALGAQIKVGIHQLGNFVVGDNASTFGVDRHIHWFGYANGVSHLNLALARQPRSHHVLGHITCGVGCGTIHFGRVLARESTTSMGAGAAVGVDNDLATRQAAITLRATDDEATGGVDQVACVVQPFLG